jgi:ribonuclease Y
VLGQSDGGGSLAFVIVALVALLLGGGLGMAAHAFATGSTLRKARGESDRIIENASLKAESDAKARQLESERVLRERREALEQELESSRAELREGERRLDKRESQIDKREAELDRERAHAQAERSKAESARTQAEADRAEAARTLEQERAALLRLSGMTQDEARQRVLERVEDEARADAAKIARRVIEQAEETSRERATEILTMAVQRYATETTSESTVRTVAIPSDDMKGRVIGREGRNIRAIEKATGADIIVDDTPGVIVVSCFDKIRQAIAVESLQRLVDDGRMHPTRIEDVVEKVRSEIGERVIKAGKEAAVEAQLTGLHPKIIEAMGKLHFRTSYGQNVLRHSIEVAYFSQIIANQLGLDGGIARRAGFLHDIGKAMDHEQEGTHPALGMAFAKQYGEKDPVLNVIGGHHGDIPSTSYYTPIVMAADALSSARPGARRESMEHYIQRLNALQDIAKSERGVEEAHAVQAGREIRVMVNARSVSDDEAKLIAARIAKRVSDEMTFPGEIRVTVLRETRAVEIAR